LHVGEEAASDNKYDEHQYDSRDYPLPPLPPLPGLWGKRLLIEHYIDILIFHQGLKIRVYF